MYEVRPTRRIDLAAFASGLAGNGFRLVRNRALDDAIEATSTASSRDVEVVVIDPSFRCTPVGAGLEAMAAKRRFALDSHAGAVLGLDEIPDDVRGPTMPALARRVA